MGEAGEAKDQWAKMTVDNRSPWDEVEVARQVEEAVQVRPDGGPWETRNAPGLPKSSS